MVHNRRFARIWIDYGANNSKQPDTRPAFDIVGEFSRRPLAEARQEIPVTH